MYKNRFAIIIIIFFHSMLACSLFYQKELTDFLSFRRETQKQEQLVAVNGSFVKSSNNNNNSNQYNNEEQDSLRIWITKTMSFKDIDETLLDIAAMNKRQNVAVGGSKPSVQIVKWKLFCYQEITYQELLTRTSSSSDGKNDNNNLFRNVEIVYWPGRQKTNFWYQYLAPNVIPNNVDYIWLMDGDISIRFMEWECFWNIQQKYQPAISAPALLMKTKQDEQSKYFPGSVHSQTCSSPTNTNTNDDSISENNNNDIHRLEALEVATLEIQLPLFTREAWTTAYTILTERFPGWGNTTSDWGLDCVWCSLVDHGLNNVTRSERQEYLTPRIWNQKASANCSLEHDEIQYPFSLKETTNDNVMDEYSGIESPSLRQQQQQKEQEQQEARRTSSSQNNLRRHRHHHHHLAHTCMTIHATPVPHLDTKSYNAAKKPTRNGGQDLKMYKSSFPEYMIYGKESRTYYRSYYTDSQCQECKHYQCATIEKE